VLLGEAMRKIVTDENGADILLDTSKDECLYSSHSNVGSNQNRWIALYAHTYKDDPERVQYYLGHFTQWQGERDYIQEITQRDAQVFAHEHLDDMSTEEERRCKDYGLFDVDAFQ